MTVTKDHENNTREAQVLLLLSEGGDGGSGWPERDVVNQQALMTLLGPSALCTCVITNTVLSRALLEGIYLSSQYSFFFFFLIIQHRCM